MSYLVEGLAGVLENDVACVNLPGKSPTAKLHWEYLKMVYRVRWQMLQNFSVGAAWPGCFFSFVFAIYLAVICGEGDFN